MVLCAMKMRGLYRAGENFKNRKESEDEDDENSGDGGGRGRDLAAAGKEVVS